ASGALDRTAFGPPVPVEEDFVGQVGAKGDSPRRSVYLQVRRTKPVSLLAAFDAPAAAPNCERRLASTAAPRWLMRMNSDFLLKQAGLLARRTRAEAPGGPAGAALSRQVAYAWDVAYQRPATAEEIDLACRFLTRRAGDLRAAGQADPEL